MPQFPTYNLPQVERQALPTVRFDPSAPSAAFGIGLGQQLQNAGELMSWNAARMQAQDDENAAFDAFYRASEAMDFYLTGGNGQPGLYARQGKAALGSTQEATHIFGEIERQGAASLQSENAKARYQRMMQQHTTTQRHNVSVFERQQRAVASEQAVGAAKANALRSVARSPDSGTIFDAKFSVVGAYRANGRSDLEIAEVFTEIDELAANNQIRTVIRENPLNAAQLLVDSEAYAHMPMAWRESWANAALTEFNEVTRAQRAEEERERKVADQRQKKLEEQTAKEADTMLAKGTLTTAWIMQNRESLSESDYRFFLDKMAGIKGEAHRNPEVFDELYERARMGEDVYEDTRKAYTSGEITREDYTMILARSEKEPAIPGKAREGLKYLEIGFGDDATLVKQGAKTRKANGILTYYEFIRNNPDATQRELTTEARGIFSRYSIIDPNEMVTSLDPLLFRVGPRLNPDIEATVDATEQAFRDGLISEAEFKEQKKLADQWASVLDKIAEMQAKKAE